MECQTCSKCPKYPVRLPCCQRLHCRGCAWRGLVNNCKYCWYPSCSDKPKLSYDLPVISNLQQDLDSVKVAPSGLIEPKQIEKPEEDSVNSNLDSNRNNQDLKTQPKFKLTCSICSKWFSIISSYKVHILTHFNQDFLSVLPQSSHYECPERGCKKSHKNWHALARHYAFKEDKFFTVTKRKPEDFPLLVKKYGRRTSEVKSSEKKNRPVCKNKEKDVPKSRRTETDGEIKKKET